MGLKEYHILMRSFNLRTTVCLVLLGGLFWPVAYVGAQGNNISIPNPIGPDTLPGVILLIATVIFNLALWVSPLMIIVAGFYFITAGGNVEQLRTARTMIMWTLIGLAITMLSLGAIQLIETILGI
ncbi:MAG: hypothetical protein US98_C0003G0007 [Parcubacteria group bacterium GW2011_GWC1_38_6]|nr:MAG: hypothetical protein US98_C0003G0007 [Parcubacteria group bacterium GW2011_GWC1_38_6]